MSSERDPNVSDSNAQHARRRARLYNTTGVILRRRDVGESDRIVVVYTRESGKRSFSARGSRKTTSKIAGQIEPFSLVSLHVAQTRGLHIVSQAEARDIFPALRLNEQAIAIAGVIAELVDSMTPEEQPNRDVFDLLIASLTLLDNMNDPILVLVAFELGLLRHLGYRPSLANCSRCGKALEAVENGFSMDSGVVCPECWRESPTVVPMSVASLKLLRAIDRGDLSSLLSLRLDPAIVAESDAILAAYVQNILGKPSRAREVYRDLRLQ